MLSAGAGRFGGVHDDRVIGVSLDMFLQVLWTLERLSAEVAFVGFQRDMDSNVGGDVISFDRRSPTGTPSTLQVQVVCAFPTYMTLANVFLGRESRSEKGLLEVWMGTWHWYSRKVARWRRRIFP